LFIRGSGYTLFVLTIAIATEYRLLQGGEFSLHRFVMMNNEDYLAINDILEIIHLLPPTYICS
jgi:hypothetical protein